MSETLAANLPKVRVSVKSALQISGMTKKEFAQALGISLTHLYELLRGEWNPSPILFAKICLLVNVPPAGLVYLENVDRK